LPVTAGLEIQTEKVGQINKNGEIGLRIFLHIPSPLSEEGG